MINHQLYWLHADTVVSALIAVVVVAMIIILGLTATLVWRCHATKKQKINSKLKQQWLPTVTQLLCTGTANTPQVLDEVPVRDNPAYQLVNLRKSWNTSISMHVTTSPTHQASQLYENIMEVDKKYGEDDNEYDYENLKVWLTYLTCKGLWSWSHFLLILTSVSLNWESPLQDL